MTAHSSNIRWQTPLRYGYECTGRYRGVEVVARMDKSNGCRVTFLGQTYGTSPRRNMAEAREGMAMLLRKAKADIDLWLDSAKEVRQ